MSSTTEPTYITTIEAAKRAGVARSAIHRWRVAGLFTWRRKDRKNVVIDEADFDRFLADLTAPISQSST